MAAQPSNVIDVRARIEHSDARLVQAARAGELWAKEALFRRHVRRLLGLAYRLMPEDDPEDLVQETFLVALPRLATVANPESFGAWLSAVLVSLVRGRLRKRRWLARLGLADAESVEVEAVISADAPVSVRDELADVYRGLERLEPEQRIALILQRVEGLELTDIAQRMGLSVATVKRRVAEADRHLAEVSFHE